MSKKQEKETKEKKVSKVAKTKKTKTAQILFCAEKARDLNQLII